MAEVAGHRRTNTARQLLSYGPRPPMVKEISTKEISEAHINTEMTTTNLVATHVIIDTEEEEAVAIKATLTTTEIPVMVVIVGWTTAIIMLARLIEDPVAITEVTSRM